MNFVKFTEYGITKIPSNYQEDFASFQFTYKVTSDIIDPNDTTLTDIPNSFASDYIVFLKVKENLIFHIKIDETNMTNDVNSFGIFDEEGHLILSGVLDVTLPKDNTSSIFVYYNLNNDTFNVQIGEYLEFQNTTSIAEILRNYYDILESLLQFRPYIDQNYMLVKFSDDLPDNLSVENAFHLDGKSYDELLQYLSEHVTRDPILVLNGYLLYHTGLNILYINNATRLEFHTYNEFIQDTTNTIQFEVKVTSQNQVVQDETSYEIEVQNVDRVGNYDYQSLSTEIDNQISSTFSNTTLTSGSTSNILPDCRIDGYYLVKQGNVFTVTAHIPETLYNDEIQVKWFINGTLSDITQETFTFLVDPTLYNVGDVIQIDCEIYDSFKNTSTNKTFNCKVCVNNPLVISKIVITNSNQLLSEVTYDVYIHVQNVDSDDSLTFNLTSDSSLVNITHITDNHFQISVNSSQSLPKLITLQAHVTSSKYGYEFTKFESFMFKNFPVHLLTFSEISCLSIHNSEIYLPRLDNAESITISTLESLAYTRDTHISNIQHLSNNIRCIYKDKIVAFQNINNNPVVLNIAANTQLTITDNSLHFINNTIGMDGTKVFSVTNKGILSVNTALNIAALKTISNRIFKNGQVIQSDIAGTYLVEVSHDTSNQVILQISHVQNGVYSTREYPFPGYDELDIISVSIVNNTMGIVCKFKNGNTYLYKGLRVDLSSYQFDIITLTQFSKLLYNNSIINLDGYDINVFLNEQTGFKINNPNVATNIIGIFPNTNNEKFYLCTTNFIAIYEEYSNFRSNVTSASNASFLLTGDYSTSLTVEDTLSFQAFSESHVFNNLHVSINNIDVINRITSFEYNVYSF